MNIIIKPLELKYLDEIRAINVSVSRHPNKPVEEKKLCRHLYIDYYALYSTDNCFVAVDSETDEVLGYVISEPNLERYKKHFLIDWIEEARSLRSDFPEWLQTEVDHYQKWNNEYEAHLHMDVKPGHQHQGIGTMLIQHEMNHLKQIGCKGVMLACDPGNINANNFYQKNGLNIIDVPSCNLRGKKL